MLTKCVGGFAVGWVGDPRMASKWTLGMCFNLQKVLEQYLTYFEKYLKINFGEKSVFLAIFQLFGAILTKNGVFKAILTQNLIYTKNS